MSERQRAMMLGMDAVELKQALESHTTALVERGMEADRPSVGDPATPAELSEVEARLGLGLPQTTRDVFTRVTCGVEWYWCGDDRFDEPFGSIFSGGMDWSLGDLVEQHDHYQDWVAECFSNSDDTYDAVWHHKLGFAHVPNGDVIAIDLDPDRYGAIVFLSHDGGKGHGYVMAASLDDLLDRWVPLACPGPEDGQWLPFVPYDLGPIDPAGENGIAWRQRMGLSEAPPRTPASTPDDALFDELIARYRAAGGVPEVQRLAHRALRVCSTDRANVVIELLDATDSSIQVEAALALERWLWRPAIDDLKRLALTGVHVGRIIALRTLQAMPWDEASQAIDDLRGRIDENLHRYLD